MFPCLPLSSSCGATLNETFSIVTAGHGDADRTLIYTGRPLRVRQTDYVKSWANRQDEMYFLPCFHHSPTQESFTDLMTVSNSRRRARSRTTSSSKSIPKNQWRAACGSWAMSRP